MNAVIALCHFCEVHGPVVVICTQPYSNKLDAAPSRLPVVEKSNNEELKTYIPSNKLFLMYDMIRQNNASNLQQRQQPCPGCTSIGKDGIPLISNDHSSQKTYMSNQSPEDSALFSLLRHACIRSLTCEITPGEDGAIFFGEESNGHVISYRFKLQNARARGLKSTYSIVVLSKDKLALLNLWPILIPNIKLYVSKLQEAAQLVFADEQALESTRSIRLGSSDLHPAVSHRSRTGDMEPRSLASITRQDKIFYNIHGWFTWLLRIGGQTFLEWNPINNDSGEDLSIFSREAIPELDLERSVKHLSELYKLLGRSQFTTLVFHTVVGNQIIVRSSCPQLSTFVTEAISILLPRGCASQGYSNVSYMQLFQYNLLALDTNVPLSSEVTSIDAAPCVVMLINLQSSEDEQSVYSDFSISSENVVVRMDSSKPPVVFPINSPIFILKPPKIVEQYLEIIHNPFKLQWRMVLTNLEIVRKEWLNRTQLYFAFKRKQISSRLTDGELEQRLMNFMKCVGIPTEADHAVVRYWVRGLTDESKKNIISSMQSSDSKSQSDSVFT